jgi:hypothetical protein
LLRALLYGFLKRKSILSSARLQKGTEKMAEKRLLPLNMNFKQTNQPYSEKSHRLLTLSDKHYIMEKHSKESILKNKFTLFILFSESLKLRGTAISFPAGG